MLKDFEIPDSLEGKSFENFEVTSPEQATALRVAKGIINGEPEVNLVHGLWLWSQKFGTGKTHLLAAIYHNLEIDPEKKLWISPVDTYGVSGFPLSKLMHGSDVPLGEHRRVVENAQAVFIDELTIKKIGPRASDFIKFFQMAYEQRLQLFASSNHPLTELGDRLESESQIVRRDRESQRVVGTEHTTSSEITGRIQSRLTQLMTPILMIGKDYRELLAQKAVEQVATILAEENQKWSSTK